MQTFTKFILNELGSIICMGFCVEASDEGQDSALKNSNDARSIEAHPGIEPVSLNHWLVVQAEKELWRFSYKYKEYTSRAGWAINKEERTLAVKQWPAVL